VLLLFSGFTTEEPENGSEYIIICNLAIGIIDEQTIVATPRPGSERSLYFFDGKSKEILGKLTIKVGETFKIIDVHLSWTYEFLGVRSDRILLSREFWDAHSRNDVQTKKTVIAVTPTEKPNECPKAF
jgi:hypothetical protein